MTAGAMPGAAEDAVIDIGSNTVRLVIYGGPPRAPEVLLNEKVTARLGRGLAENGTLSPSSRETALAALRRFAALLRFRGVASVRTVATAAVREAADGTSFLDDVREAGLEPRLLSGEEEALKSALGVAAAFPGARGVVADLGGGSLELVHIDGLQREHGVSLPLGTLRLQGLRDSGSEKFARRVRKLLRGSGWNGTADTPLYLVGGSFRAFARYAMIQTAWPIDDPHGFELAPELARKLCHRLARTRQLPPIPELSAQRLSSLPDTAALFAVLIGEIAPTRLVFSSWGLREGVLFRDRAAIVESMPPLLAGATTFAASLGIDAAAGEAVAKWTAIAAHAPGARPDPAREQVRLGAILLALASQRLEPNLRLETATAWALRKRWVGIDAEGRALMAACVLGNGGVTELPGDLFRLASPDCLAEAAGWGLAVRLCRRFSGLSFQAMAASALKRQDDVLSLSLDGISGPLAASATEKDLKRLAQHLGLVPRIERAS